jgi:PAS domain S-box-containing protein
MRLAGTSEPQPALEAVLETIVEAHTADFGLLSLYDPASKCLTTAASIGFDDDALECLSTVGPGSNAGACGCAFATRERVVVHDVEEDSRFEESRAVARTVGFRAVHSTPILTRAGEALGVISVHFKTCRQPTESEMQLADLCARHAADAIDAATARQTIRESEERLRLATQTGKVGIWDWDIAANRVSWTESLYRIHGLAPHEFDGTVECFSALVHPDDRELVAEAIRRSLTESETYEVEFRAVRPDGEVIWLFTSATTVHADGRPVRMYGATMDITASKHAQQVASENQERFVRFMEHLPGLAWIKDASGKYVFANDAAHKSFQTTPAKLYGKTDREVFPEETARRFRENDETALASDSGHQTVETLEHEDGRLHYSLVHKFPIPSPDGAGMLIGGMAIDITDRKHAEESLRESEQRFRNMADHAPVMIWVTEADGRCTFLGKTWYEFTGRTPETSLGFGWIDAMHPNDRETARRLFLAANEAHTAYSLEYRLRDKDGIYHWVIDAAMPRFAEDGRFLGYIGSVIDITDRKKFEEDLREADRRKDEFLAVLAHELRNPLAPIRTGLELMRLAGDDASALEEVRTTMERQSQQMVRLIDDLLDVSRITRGAVDLRKSRVELATVLESAVETSRPLIEEMGHKLEVTIPKQPIVLEADPTRLAQVISNLLNNAAKYMPRGGTIRVSAERLDGTAIISVKDSGIGIPPEMIERIFDMFTQVDGSLERSHGGLGIGLTLVKRLVEMHGGSVEAHSDGLNEGSEFIVRLPAVVGLLREPPPKDGSGRPAGAKRRILVVDDNENAAKVLGMLLTALGNDVRTAFDGFTAIELAESFLPEIILLDIGMPKLNGYETARRIREQPWGKNMVLAALTGWGQEEDKRRTREAGFDHHFVKPLEPATLQKLLAEYEPAAY